MTYLVFTTWDMLPCLLLQLCLEDGRALEVSPVFCFFIAFSGVMCFFLLHVDTFTVRITARRAQRNKFFDLGAAPTHPVISMCQTAFLLFYMFHLFITSQYLLRELFELAFPFINSSSAVSILLLNLIVEYFLSSNLKIHNSEAEGESDLSTRAVH